MPCYHPMEAYQSLNVDKETGKTHIQWNRKGLEEITKGETEEQHDQLFWNDSEKSIYKRIMLPCGQCVGCCLDYAKEKAKRVEMESHYTTGNYFITLTYDDEHLPYNDIFKGDQHLIIPTLRKAHLKKMINQMQTLIRKKYNIKMVFLACGEYGDHTNRPHYHAVLLNCPLNDLKPLSASGNKIQYTSKTMYHYWPYGQHLICINNTATTAYTAQYCMKKIGAKKEDDAREQQFVIQSRNIGKRYIEEHAEELKESDKFLFGNKMQQIPKFADKILDTSDEVKRKRQQRAKNKSINYAINNGLENATQYDIRTKQEEKMERNVKSKPKTI